ncbi:small, acid-soluble spore protein, alpha/beta type [Sporomusa termitida]|uniref:Small, acid-soluble spore protein, alpha/beta type n=1 Tax=Sporomusa termitida TaxID=2377 RepID=A0A517DU36_9FIRM|nr:small, acid-soluble spore protein, alpha/beta type [Sporomusa termitida]QDR80872.1 Small, acid-soluble spore protein, alpha/beta type [Sporomusa termitida]
MDRLEKLKMSVANETLGNTMNTEITSASCKSVVNERKTESAEELGFKEKIDTAGRQSMTTGEAGKIGGSMGGHSGGQMVKNLMAMAEAQMAPVDGTTLEEVKKQLAGKR